MSAVVTLQDVESGGIHGNNSIHGGESMSGSNASGMALDEDRTAVDGISDTLEDGEVITDMHEVQEEIVGTHTMEEQEIPQLSPEEDGEVPMLPPPQPMMQPLTPEEMEDPPIPEPVHHEEVNLSTLGATLLQHNLPAFRQVSQGRNHGSHGHNNQPIQHVVLPPGHHPPPVVAAAPKLTPHEVSLITEAASKPGPNGTFQCTLCNKQFGYKNGLIRHIRLTHVGEKPYECNICHRRFGYKHILMEHQNLHYGHRPYACTMCDKRFAARSNLIQHRTVHKRPYNCNLCNKRFDKEDQLKKHLFAHPQALIHCTLCKFAAANQNDLNKHIMEAHAAVLQEGLKRNGEELSPPHLSPRGMDRLTEPITPPSTVGSPQDLSQHPSPPNLATRPLVSSKGHLINAICNQLSTSIANAPEDRFGNLIIKKENGEEMTANGEAALRMQQSIEAIYSSAGGDLQRVSVAAMYTNPTTGLPTGLTQEEVNKVMEEANKSSLPGIQEMFSRRTPTIGGVPPGTPGTPNIPMTLPNYGVPLAISAAAIANSTGLPGGQHHELPNILMSPPPNFAAYAQRQTGQLQSLTQDGSNGTRRDQAIQHTAPIPGFPSLEDVLAYYMGQGKLFKCQHCDVMFFERGMYFLHASLHGNSSPWECSICHKICADKNEFTIHFVNQQHNS